jgi:uncharacterized protein involved in outer membrane biogenesis
MSTAKRKRWILLALFVSLPVMAVLLVVALIDTDRYIPMVSDTIHKATGLTLTVEGGSGLTLLPVPALVVDDFTLSGPDGPILACASLRVRVNPAPLLSREVEVTSIRLLQPLVSIARDAQGRLELPVPPAPPPAEEQPPSGKLPVSRVSVSSFVIEDGTVDFTDQQSGRKLRAEGITLTAGPFPLVADSQPIASDATSFLAATPFTARLDVDHIRSGVAAVETLSAVFENRGGHVHVRDVQAMVMGSQLTGSGDADLTASTPAWHLAMEMPAIDTRRFLELTGEKKLKVDGRIAARLKLSGQSGLPAGLLPSLDGTVALTSDGLQLDGIDLDKVLDKYEKSSEYDLLDLSSYLVMGPFGPILTNAVDMGDTVLAVDGGRSDITRLVSRWEIRKGVARAKDCAFRTRRNRVAVKGAIDTGRREMKKLTIAVLNGKGCSKFGQTFNGPLQENKMEVTSFTLDTLTRPVVSLFKKGADLLFDSECEPFYTGEVAHPAGAE